MIYDMMSHSARESLLIAGGTEDAFAGVKWKSHQQSSYETKSGLINYESSEANIEHNNTFCESVSDVCPQASSLHAPLQQPPAIQSTLYIFYILSIIWNWP